MVLAPLLAFFIHLGKLYGGCVILSSGYQHSFAAPGQEKYHLIEITTLWT